MLVSLSEGSDKRMSEDLTKRLTPSDKDEILTEIKNLDSRLGRLEQTVDERLYDTRPNWQKVLADIEQMQAGQQRLERGQDGLRLQITELSSIVLDVNRDQIVINEAIRKIQLDFHAIDKRLHQLELNSN